MNIIDAFKGGYKNYSLFSVFKSGEKVFLQEIVESTQPLKLTRVYFQEESPFLKETFMKSNKIIGSTILTGLIGNPVSHSISPIIHNHAFAVLDLNYTYIPLGTAPETLDSMVKTLRSMNWAGANVTIPYKSDIIRSCDKISTLSQLTGTVNTLYWKDDQLCGTTTDADGFLQALKSDSFDITNKKVVILGNGGTAQTLAIVLAHKKLPSEITIIGRNKEKIESLANEVSSKTDFPITTITFSDDKLHKTTLDSDIIINCTPIGMSPHSDKSPLPKEALSSTTYIFDAIYNPGETELLRLAREKGCSHQNGLKMLLFQGLESFQYWTGKRATEEIFNINELQALVTKK